MRMSSLPLSSRLPIRKGRRSPSRKRASPLHGTLSGFTAAGSFKYLPNVNFTGSDSPSACADGLRWQRRRRGPFPSPCMWNHPPTAGNEAVRADGSALNAIAVLSQAKDPDGDPLTVTIAKQPLVGMAAVMMPTVPSQASRISRRIQRRDAVSYRVADRARRTQREQSQVSRYSSVSRFIRRRCFRQRHARGVSHRLRERCSARDAGDTRRRALAGFATSASGATICTAARIPAPERDRSLVVQSSSPGTGVQVALPSGAAPVTDSSGKDRYR